MATDATWIQNFDQAGNDPSMWAFYAENLLFAADVLEREYKRAESLMAAQGPLVKMPESARVFGPMLLLRAAAVECLLKAIGLKRGSFVLAKEGSFQKVKGIPPHDLLALTSVVGEQLSARESGVLRRLSLWLMAGRFPIQTRWTRGLVPSMSGVGKAQEAWCRPSDDEELTRIVARFMTILS